MSIGVCCFVARNEALFWVWSSKDAIEQLQSQEINPYPVYEIC